MFIKREEAYPIGVTMEVRFRCPKCHEEGEYYAWPPEVCNSCGFHLEDLLLIHHLYDRDELVTYYRDGEL